MKRMLVLLLLLCLLPCVVWAEDEEAVGFEGATEAVAAAESVEAAEPADVTDEAGATEAVEVAEEADAAETADSVETAEVTGSAEAEGAAEVAETSEVAEAGDDDARIYVIKKGDTLWGISRRFIKDPEYWPNLWANNPFVTNPHLIYPGQKIKFHDGRIEIVPTTPEDEVEAVIEPEIAVVPDLPVPEPVEELTLRVAGGEGYVLVEDLNEVGLIADTIDNRYMMVAGDTVFVTFGELGAVRPGDRFDVVRPIGRVTHPRSGRYLGEKISELGVIEVQQVHSEVATGVVIDNNFEMQRGDLLLMPAPTRQEIVLKKAPAGVTGVVAEARMPNVSISENDFIYVDVGSDDGIEKGNMLYIARERRASELAAAQNLRLPDRLMGAALIVDVGPKLSTALVLKSVDAIVRGDKVFTQAD